MPQKVVVVGAGGMGRCVLDVVDAVNAASSGSPLFEVVGVVDDSPQSLELLDQRGVSFLGAVDSLADLPGDVGYVIGIGNGAVRRRVAELPWCRHRTAARVVHPNVHLGHGVRLGHGVVICSHVSIENNVVLGDHSHVNQNSTVGHDSVIGDYVTISPLAAVSGSTVLESESFVGTNATLRQGLTVGVAAVVGAGAVVLRDVPPGVTAVGNPARW